MVAELSQLAILIEEGAIPQWIRDKIEQNKDQISQALREGITFSLHGPQGQEVTITQKKKGGKAKVANAA
jgi:hypothetical protein